MKEIAKRIADTIEDSDKSIKQIAELLGCSTKQVTRWKTGQQEMGIYKLKAFCEITGKSSDYILKLPDDLEKPRPRKETKSESSYNTNSNNIIQNSNVFFNK